MSAGHGRRPARSRDGGVLTVTAFAPLLPGTAVRMDVDGGMVLGEVVASETGSTRCYLSIKIDQVIPSLSELATLVQRKPNALILGK